MTEPLVTKTGPDEAERLLDAVQSRLGDIGEGAAALLVATGFSDEEIIEIAANVALNMFGVVFTQIASPKRDFLAIPDLDERRR